MKTYAIKNKPSLRSRIRSWWAYGLLVFVGLVFFLIPLIWLLLTSVKQEYEYLSWPVKILPRVPQWNNYVQAVTMIKYGRFLANSLYLATVYPVLVTISSAMVGYGFSRFRVRGSSLLFKILVSTLMIPGIVTFIPQFVVLSRVGLVGTYWPWVLWGLGTNSFYVFLYRQFFSTIPKELEEAAEIDGCGLFNTFWRIILPNMKPAVATVSIFAFRSTWGDYFKPLIYLRENDTTLAVQLAEAYVDPMHMSYITITIAGCVIFMIPVVIVFFLGQKYIVEGIVTTGIKG